MGNRVATTSKSSEHENEYDGYVMIDTRAVILDLPEEARTALPRPLRRGLPRPESEPEHGPVVGRAMHSGPLRHAVAEASATVSFWERLGRKLGAWSGAAPRQPRPR